MHYEITNYIVFRWGTKWKSEFAERLALATEGRKAYVATGQAFDDEMVDRIKKHQERRGNIWTNFEIPLYLAEEWQHISSVADVILIDCLTMFTTNHMMAHGSITRPTRCKSVRRHGTFRITSIIKSNQSK